MRFRCPTHTTHFVICTKVDWTTADYIFINSIHSYSSCVDAYLHTPYIVCATYKNNAFLIHYMKFRVHCISYRFLFGGTTATPVSDDVIIFTQHISTFSRHIHIHKHIHFVTLIYCFEKNLCQMTFILYTTNLVYLANVFAKFSMY